jgi:hypothetical protein
MNMRKVEKIKSTYQPGTRIKLEEMAGEPDMPWGLTGIVQAVDDIGQIHMKWDNGRSLALNPDIDIFQIIENENDE